MAVRLRLWEAWLQSEYSVPQRTACYVAGAASNQECSSGGNAAAAVLFLSPGAQHVAHGLHSAHWTPPKMCLLWYTTAFIIFMMMRVCSTSVVHGCHRLIDIYNVLNELVRRVWTCSGKLAPCQVIACIVISYDIIQLTSETHVASWWCHQVIRLDVAACACVVWGRHKHCMTIYTHEGGRG